MGARSLACDRCTAGARRWLVATRPRRAVVIPHANGDSAPPTICPRRYSICHCRYSISIFRCATRRKCPPRGFIVTHTSRCGFDMVRNECCCTSRSSILPARPTTLEHVHCTSLCNFTRDERTRGHDRHAFCASRLCTHCDRIANLATFSNPASPRTVADCHETTADKRRDIQRVVASRSACPRLRRRAEGTGIVTIPACSSAHRILSRNAGRQIVAGAPVHALFALHVVEHFGQQPVYWQARTRAVAPVGKCRHASQAQRVRMHKTRGLVLLGSKAQRLSSDCARSGPPPHRTVAIVSARIRRKVNIPHKRAARRSEWRHRADATRRPSLRQIRSRCETPFLPGVVEVARQWSC